MTSVDLITTLTVSPSLERHLLRAPPSDHAFDQVFANAHHDVCHHTAELYLFNGPFELIAGRKCHVTRLNPIVGPGEVRASLGTSKKYTRR